ncbi:MAG: HEPN domain-containing protein [Spirosomataceae bacterium]
MDKEVVIKYRIDRANETIEEAKIMAQFGHWNTTANRLYYACFYVVIALFLKDGIITKTHNGVISILVKDYLHKGIITQKEAWLFGDLFNKRQESDYKDVRRFSKEEIEPLISEVEKFILMIRELIGQ